MIILGISDSIESHACVLKDGKLIGAVAEERFSRLKSDTGYPKKSIDYLLKYLINFLLNPLLALVGS